jgi:TRAP-type C4-dicarboxylate transport system substrate-binding protein
MMMTTRRGFVLAVVAALLLGGGSARADKVRIKLGTLAPKDSTWYTILKEMGQKWQEASGGQVELVIYAGGVAGNEGDMVKKMRVKQLQAAALTTVGLHEITPEPQAVGVPLLVDSWDLLDKVMEKVGPQLEKALDAKGYVVIGWSEVGFVRFFSTKKMATVADLRKAKIFCWEGDPASADAWRAGGFQPVVMSSTDIVPSLQTGLIDTVAMAPLYAYTSQMFQHAKYMLDAPWALLNGATVVRKDVWDQIPAETRTKMMAIAREYVKKIGIEVRRMDSEALDNMKKKGLEIVKPADEHALRAAAQATYKVIRGKVVPEGIFDQVQKITEENRKK